MKQICRGLVLIVLSLPLFGITMCSKKNTEEESLRRARVACVQAIRGGYPGKAELIRTFELSAMAMSMAPGFSDVKGAIDTMKTKPYLAAEADKKIEAILADTTLSVEEGDKRLKAVIEPTTYWSEVCSVRVKNEIQRCGDKFEFDGADFQACMSSSPLMNPEWIGDWSPFFGEYYKNVKPKLTKMGLTGV